MNLEIEFRRILPDFYHREKFFLAHIRFLRVWVVWFSSADSSLTHFLLGHLQKKRRLQQERTVVWIEWGLWPRHRCGVRGFACFAWRTLKQEKLRIRDEKWWLSSAMFTFLVKMYLQTTFDNYRFLKQFHMNDLFKNNAQIQPADVEIWNSVLRELSRYLQSRTVVRNGHLQITTPYCSVTSTIITLLAPCFPSYVTNRALRQRVIRSPKESKLHMKNPKSRKTSDFLSTLIWFVEKTENLSQSDLPSVILETEEDWIMEENVENNASPLPFVKGKPRNKMLSWSTASYGLIFRYANTKATSCDRKCGIRGNDIGNYSSTIPIDPVFDEIRRLRRLDLSMKTCRSQKRNLIKKVSRLLARASARDACALEFGVSIEKPAIEKKDKEIVTRIPDSVRKKISYLKTNRKVSSPIHRRALGGIQKLDHHVQVLKERSDGKSFVQKWLFCYWL